MTVNTDVQEAAGDRFKSYALDSETIKAGYTFNSANKCVIQNLISAYAHDHLQLTFDSADPAKAAIHQAYIRGAIDALGYLLDVDGDLAQAKPGHTI